MESINLYELCWSSSDTRRKIKRGNLKNKDTHEMYKISEIGFNFKQRWIPKKTWLYEQFNNWFWSCIYLDLDYFKFWFIRLNSNILSNYKKKLKIEYCEVSDPINIPAAVLLNTKKCWKRNDLKELQKAKDYELTSQLVNLQ